MTDYTEIYKSRIVEYLKQHDRKCIPHKELYAVCKGRRALPDKFKEAVHSLKNAGIIFERKAGFILCSSYGIYIAEVSKTAKTFGFIKTEEGVEVFVPGKYLKGAMPGDKVLAKPLNRSERRGGAPEGEVVKILEERFKTFSGVVKRKNGKLYVYPDSAVSIGLEIVEMKEYAEEDDKVLAEIIKRGDHQLEHICRITGMFGRADKASSTAAALIKVNGIETDFPPEVREEAEKIEKMKITESEIFRRLDLRDEIIFTIDGADTKDIDDAVSVEKTDNGYKLGVHIADVSHYVKSGTALDNDAFMRGTSIYYADKVIPMLPKELSNGICSLNPMEDRLAFSCIMELDGDGALKSFKFSKTVIRSRVKGVYSEINKIFDARGSLDTLPSDISEKYGGLFDTLFTMLELSEKLTARKLKRGAPQIETPECKIITDSDDVCIDVIPRERGKAEVLIEEFMLMANTCAARLGKEKGIPFVYRIHEDPSPEKIDDLKDVITRLGLPVPKFTEVKPRHLADILESAKGKPCELLVNNTVLRSMAKAKYSDEPVGHFGLALSDYAHFTSPIRRYPDLSVHRILTDLCYEKKTEKVITKRYAAFAKASSERSSECELTAMRLERECENCYIAEYMSSHVGESYAGIISSVTEYGFYVELPNTVEGFVPIESLPSGLYEYDGHFTISRGGERQFTVGKAVNVICTRADVSNGKIYFSLELKRRKSHKKLGVRNEE